MKPRLLSASAASSSSSAAHPAAFAASTPRPSVSRDWVSMPHYPTTLDGFARPLSADAASTLLSLMMDALSFLHQHHLAHMDVKPSNLFVDADGHFWLADFGSVRNIGTSTTSTTPTFLPAELRMPALEAYVASELHDWWMLGMTVTDMLTVRPEDGVGSGATDPTRSQVLFALDQLATQSAAQLKTRLGQH